MRSSSLASAMLPASASPKASRLWTHSSQGAADDRRQRDGLGTEMRKPGGTKMRVHPLGHNRPTRQHRTGRQASEIPGRHSPWKFAQRAGRAALKGSCGNAVGSSTPWVEGRETPRATRRAGVLHKSGTPRGEPGGSCRTIAAAAGKVHSATCANDAPTRRMAFARPSTAAAPLVAEPLKIRGETSQPR